MKVGTGRRSEPTLIQGGPSDLPQVMAASSVDAQGKLTRRRFLRIGGAVIAVTAVGGLRPWISLATEGVVRASDHLGSDALLSVGSDYIVAGTFSSGVRIWEVDSGRLVWEASSKGGPVAFSPDLEFLLLLGDRPDTVEKLGTHDLQRSIAAESGEQAPLESLAVSPDGSLAVGTFGSANVHVWDTATGASLGVFRNNAKVLSADLVTSRSAMQFVRANPRKVLPNLRRFVTIGTSHTDVIRAIAL